MAINIHRNTFVEYDPAQEVFEIGHDSKGYCFTVKRPNGSVVATLPNGLRPQEKALARLFANAPAMLDCLEQILAEVQIKDEKLLNYILETVDNVRGEECVS